MYSYGDSEPRHEQLLGRLGLIGGIGDDYAQLVPWLLRVGALETLDKGSGIL